MKRVRETNFGCFKSVHELTQYMRGELFIYVDFIFSYDYTSLTVEVPSVVIFLKSVLKLLCQWLQWLSTHLASYREFKNYPLLFLVDRNVALAACMEEVIFMLGLFFGRSHHSLKFFLVFSRNKRRDTI